LVSDAILMPLVAPVIVELGRLQMDCIAVREDVPRSVGYHEWWFGSILVRARPGAFLLYNALAAGYPVLTLSRNCNPVRYVKPKLRRTGNRVSHLEGGDDAVLLADQIADARRQPVPGSRGFRRALNSIMRSLVQTAMTGRLIPKPSLKRSLLALIPEFAVAAFDAASFASQAKVIVRFQTILSL
jgi:hypothetical protein